MNVIRNTTINLKPYPLSFEEIEAFRYFSIFFYNYILFRYRIEDVATNISKH